MKQEKEKAGKAKSDEKVQEQNNYTAIRKYPNDGASRE